MKKLNYVLLITSFLVMFCSQANASRYPDCAINEFEASASLERNLKWGIYGDWNDSFEESMITVYDHNEQPTDYYSISKKPSDAKPRQLVLFLHGFPEFSWAWEKQLEYLGDEYHAVALDLKGHHYSSKPDDIAEYDFVKLAREVKEVVRCLDYESLTLVGHDFGGVLSYVFASLYPEMLNGLVILNAPHPYIFGREYNNPEGDQKEKSEYMEYAQGDGFIDRAKFLKIILSDQSLFESDFYDNNRKNRLLKENWAPLGNWARMKSYYRAMSFPPSPDEFKPRPTDTQKAMFTIRAPTMVLWGLDDPYFSTKLLDGLDEWIPDLELTTFEEHTHWIAHELPDFNEYLEDFLNRHPPGNEQ